MTINATDVKLQQPERLTDNADGGGLMTGNEIVDGQVNNLFPNISRLDRTLGRVNLRKAFLHVDTENVDVLLGSHIIITAQPADPLVHLVLFDTGEPADERSGAADFVAKYLVEGPTTGLQLYDTQVSGQRTILCYASPTVTAPVPGDAIALSVEHSGYPAHVQFLRITSVSSEQQDFIIPTNNNQTVTRNVITLSLSAPLDQDYPGEDPTTLTSVANSRTKVRTTRVADAASFYGITNLTTAVSPGDKVLAVSSVYGQIIPSTTEESPLLDQLPAGTRAAVIAAGSALSTSIAFAQGGDTHYLGSPVAPGSLNITLESATYIDRGGVIVPEATGVWSGTIDYVSGTLYLVRSSGSASSTAAISWVPAGVAQQAPFSTQTVVDEATRREVYTFALQPLPAPGSVTISYRALGRWYVLQDNGRGNITGAIDGTGSGIINYGTGSLSASLAALPDVGSSILVAWGQKQTYTIQTGVLSVATPVIEIDAPAGKAIDPSSVSITWNDGTDRTATDNGAGTISGDAAGRVDYGAGVIKFSPNTIPAKATAYTVAYQTGDVHDDTGQTGTVTGTGIASQLTGTLGPAPIKAGTVSLTLTLTPDAIPDGYTFFNSGSPVPTTQTLVVSDDGAGNLLDDTGATIGSITYSSGAFSVTPNYSKQVTLASYSGTAP